MVNRHIVALLKLQSIQLIGHHKDAVTHTAHLKIPTDFSLIQIVLGLTHLLGIVTPIPKSQIKVVAFTVDHLLQHHRFLTGNRQRRIPNLLKEAVHRFHITCHPVIQRKISKSIKTQQLNSFQTQLGQLIDDLPIVERVVVVPTVDVGPAHLLTQIAIIGIGQKRHHAGIVQGKKPFAFLALLCSSFSRCRHYRSRQSRKVLFRLDKQLKIIDIGQHILTKLQRQYRQFLIDFPEAFLLFSRQSCATAHKALIGVFQQHGLLFVQTKRFALLVNSRHALEQIGIETDVVRMRRQHRCYFLSNLLYLVRSVGRVKVVKYRRHLVQQTSAVIQCSYGILEAGRFFAGNNGSNLFLLLTNLFLKGRYKMFVLNLLKRRHTKRRVVFGKKRIVSILHLPTSRHHHHRQNKKSKFSHLHIIE